jgi:hypothetical protein
MRDILIPNTNKKVIGFDLFNSTESQTLSGDNTELSKYYTNCGISYQNGIAKSTINKFASSFDNYKLIEGNIQETLPEYNSKYPGFRISLLYLDLDIDEPTYISLRYLYDRVVRGGVIVFDEYACERWNESNAVDRFLSEHPEIQLKTIKWAKTPTAYFIKP